MKSTCITNVKKDEEIQIYHYGIEVCENGHGYGPAVRDHFLIHFILDGKGIFKSNGITYHLNKNKGFLITPERVTYYEADMDTPWTYCWIGFNGIKAYQILKDGDLTYKDPIISFDDDCLIPHTMEKIIATDIKSAGSSLKLKSYLYLVLSEIQRVNCMQAPTHQKKNYTEEYIEKALDFIEKNYSRSIKVTDIAKHIGLDRSYFTSIFKEIMNISPQRYLIEFRMKKAAYLLESTDLSIGDIARSVGYKDPLGFSKVYKSIVGISPSKYRKVGSSSSPFNR